jgi:hypothetical protein
MNYGRKKIVSCLILIPLIYQISSPPRSVEHTRFVINSYSTGQQLDSEMSVKVQGPENLNGAFGDPEARLTARVRLVIPMSLKMIDVAINVLDKGWDGMDPIEQYYFRLFFDPGDTGLIDQEFVQEASLHFQKISAELEGTITLVLESESEHCEHERLYFTYWRYVHVCPFFVEDPNPQWMASVLVHELAHIALKVNDREYYNPTSEAYASLTPRGPQVTQVPVVGPIIREILRTDTLYHPDAYAWFGAMMLHEANRRAATGEPSRGGQPLNER